MKILRNISTFYGQKVDFMRAKHVVCSVNTVFQGLQETTYLAVFRHY
jgi:hypothetical protein